MCDLTDAKDMLGLKGAVSYRRHEVSPCSRGEFVKDVHTRLLLDKFNFVYGTDQKKAIHTDKK